MKTRLRVHGVRGEWTRCGQRSYGVRWSRDPAKWTCRACIESPRAAGLGCYCGHDDHGSDSCWCGCLYTPLADLFHWIELEVIWLRWGAFYYETREQMWRRRVFRPLFPVVVALGAPGVWLTPNFVPPPAIVADVAQIRADFKARTGKDLTL